jgi:hypothetical protein
VPEASHTYTPITVRKLPHRRVRVITFRSEPTLANMLPIIDLDIFRSQPLDSPVVVAECNKVSVQVSLRRE